MRTTNVLLWEEPDVTEQIQKKHLEPPVLHTILLTTCVYKPGKKKKKFSKDPHRLNGRSYLEKCSRTCYFVSND